MRKKNYVLVFWILVGFLVPNPQASDLLFTSPYLKQAYSRNPQIIHEISTFWFDLANRFSHLGMAACLGFASCLSFAGWSASIAFPWFSFGGKECLFFANLTLSGASSMINAAIHSSFSRIFVPDGAFKPACQKSWEFYRQQLADIPIISEEGKELVSFLEKRWLAKGNGFYRFEVDFACPCFQIPIQVHPSTTNCYARDPSTRSSLVYLNRVNEWKNLLPHPESFPLILTRPNRIEEYLPNCFVLSSQDSLSSILDVCTKKLEESSNKIILDVSPILSIHKSWDDGWKRFQDHLFSVCLEKKIDPLRFICVQSTQGESMGALRVLRSEKSYSLSEGEDYHELLGWISNSGLTCTIVELDRNVEKGKGMESTSTSQGWMVEDFVFASPFLIKENCLLQLSEFRKSFSSHSSQNDVLIGSFLDALQGLLSEVNEEKWKEIVLCPTRASLLDLSMKNIVQIFDVLHRQEGGWNFFQTAAEVELLYANLTALLEMFSPFDFPAFDAIYRNILSSVPKALRLQIRSTVHASGMTSLAGVLKAVSKNLEALPKIIYGDNTYFECVQMVSRVSARSSSDAKGEDWREVDLLIGQFNPVLKRGDIEISQYEVEDVAGNIRKALLARKDKPFTVIIDATLDYIDSNRTALLLEEFQDEIIRGSLNFICMRSGVKFDLFGMDNYAGAPFFMIHSSHPHWDEMDAILEDPVLRTDRLSYHWFCLAYKYLVPHLEAYRRQIFENTRGLLNKIPKSLFDPTSSYRVIPMEKKIDPAFIDIRVGGPFHRLKIAAFVGGVLYLRCMQNGHPIFCRRSLGLYHPNFGILFGDDCSIIRLTLGLDPDQVDVIAKCLQSISTLN